MFTPELTSLKREKPKALLAACQIYTCFTPAETPVQDRQSDPLDLPNLSTNALFLLHPSRRQLFIV
ncbi:hypothetical protein D791_01100 [Nitrincola nitratireducens]|uniref:Uncharacterized protein n=1 Tax=Nitrincola nitratireducens TaxID=1229521 RepID=W9V5K2_9GAMM|nr:hypothetical protein D791_01100 [Nitrincola nitratireducens]